MFHPQFWISLTSKLLSHLKGLLKTNWWLFQVNKRKFSIFKTKKKKTILQANISILMPGFLYKILITFPEFYILNTQELIQQAKLGVSYSATGSITRRTSILRSQLRWNPTVLQAQMTMTTFLFLTPQAMLGSIMVTTRICWKTRVFCIRINNSLVVVPLILLLPLTAKMLTSFMKTLPRP